MLKIKNLNEALKGATFHSRRETWFIEPAHVSNGFNLMENGIVKGYIVDSTKFNMTSGKRNVFGFIIDFRAENIIISVHGKGTGWSVKDSWSICNIDNFRNTMSSKDMFLALIRHALTQNTIWESYLSL